MPVVIIIAFDGENTAILNRVYKKLKDNKFNSYYELVMPHITLTWYEDIDLQVAKERLNQLCNSLNPFRIQFSSFGYFPSEESVLFLNPKANVELLDIQQKVFELFDDFQVGENPQTWVPHCTLATDVPMKEIGKAIDIVKDNIIMKIGEPFYVDAQSMCIVDFEMDPLKIISINEFKLKKTD